MTVNLLNHPILHTVHASFRRYTGLVALCFFAVVSGCGDDPVSESLPLPEALTVADLPADPPTQVDPVTGRPVGTGAYTYFSLRENEVVPEADSATTAWDLAFRGTTILTNSGTSGPGEGGAVLVAQPFEAVVEAPAAGAFAVDAEGAPATVSDEQGSWYHYNPATHVITPVPGRTLVIRTADGRYAKVRIVSYYKGNPDTVDADSASRYYTFDYVFQPDGSRTLE